MRQVLKRYLLSQFSLRHILVDSILIVISLYFSLWFRLGTVHLQDHLADLHRFVGVFVPLRILVFVGAGVYRIMWRYVSARDAVRIASAVFFSTPLLISVTYLAPSLGRLPRSLFAIDAFVLIGLLMGVRMIRRQIYEGTLRPGQKALARGKMLIYGAGRNGRLFAQRQQADLTRELLGFIDDDSAKANKRIAGLTVLGRRGDLDSLLENTGCTELVVAIDRPSPELMRDLLVTCRQHNVRLLKTAPPESEAPFKKVDLSDLLNRHSAQIDLPSVKSLLENKVVLVTGAGGSIGSELARQIASWGPRKLLLLDHSEFNLYEVDRELRPQTQDFSRVVPLLVDVKDRGHLEKVFENERPQVIFHAAAYKHVHLVEANVTSAIINNVLGTKHLVELAEKYDCERFVMISTDKAVNPVGAMGASKRVCEILTTQTGVRLGRKFSSVRFGNVLGSSGSLIPLLKQQIENGGPVTLTHPDMTRYFMLIPEAVSLVLMSATLSEPGDINVLKMGEPIRILDLAKNLITLMGRDESEIAIAFTGVRPGEKMYEELYITGDELTTRHPDILTVPRVGMAQESAAIWERVERLLQLSRANDPLALDLLLEIANSHATSRPSARLNPQTVH